MTQSRPLLRIDQATKRFRLASTEVVAVDGVSLDLFHGETLAVVGESGSGKSTLANLILGSETADSGTILLDGTPLEKRGAAQLSAELDTDSRRALRGSFSAAQQVSEGFRERKTAVGADLRYRPFPAFETGLSIFWMNMLPGNSRARPWLD